MEHGRWDQIQVDNGCEFYLTLYIQDKLRANCGDPNILPYIQITSTQNHITESMAQGQPVSDVSNQENSFHDDLE